MLPSIVNLYRPPIALVQPASMTLPQFGLTFSAPAPLPPWAFAGDFYTALVAWFNADLLLSRTFTGGIISDKPGPAQTMPYVRVVENEPREAAMSTEDRPMEADFFVYAISSDLAIQYAKVLLGKLDATDQRPPLTFSGWQEGGHIGIKTSHPIYLGPLNDVQVWRYDFSFRFWIVAAYAIAI